jgi:hypothetical protein
MNPSEFFVVLGFELRTLHLQLARQALCHFRNAPSPEYFVKIVFIPEKNTQINLPH